MLKVERSTDYLKGASLEITEPIEEEQNTQQSSKSFQPKPRIRRQYSPNDNNLQLLSLIARCKQDPALINDIKGLLNDVDINYRDKDGDTFLHAAIQEEHQDVVKLLLERGAKIDIENNVGKTPLSLANELDNSNPNKQSIIQMLDQARQKDDKRKRKQPPSDPNKRQKFDQDNSFQFAEKTLNQQDYQVWLTQEDIANIARIKYGWYGENSNVLFEVIGSLGQLDVELKRHKEIPKAPSKQSLIFIINLNSNHWVTLVIIHQNQQFSAYYINSFGDEITSDIRDKLNSAMPGIQISNPKFKQQEDGYNCGIFALENARIINDKIKSGKTNLEIEQALKGYELTSDDLKNKRKEFAEALQQQKRTRTDSDSRDHQSVSSEIKESGKRSKPSTSSNLQQSSDSGQQTTNKRPFSETDSQEEVSQNKKVKHEHERFLDNSKQPEGGLKLAQHGNLFQLKLLMLFLWRAKNNQYNSFRIATEMGEAEKFDDVVLQYKPSDSEKWKFSFLQAKHKDDSNKDKIGEKELLSTNNDDSFSLQKYFHSYMKIKRRIEEGSIYSVFTDSEVEDLIICTNTDFDSEQLRSRFEEKNIEDDQILRLDKVNNLQWENASIRKLENREDELIKKLKPILKDTSDFNRLVEELADKILSDDQINNKDLFKEYCYPLIRDIFDIKSSPVKEKEGSSEKYQIFLKQQSNDVRVQDFMNSLLREIIFKDKGSKGDSWENKAIKISKDFGKTPLPSDEGQLKKIAKVLAEKIRNNEELTPLDFLDQNVSESKYYHIALIKDKVINVKDKKFYGDFFKKSGGHLRDYLRDEMYKMGEIKVKTFAALEGLLKNRELNISEEFGKSELPSDYAKLEELAKNLAEKVKNGEQLTRSDFEDYHVELAKELIDTETSNFKEIFINRKVKKDDGKYDHLSSLSKAFRRIFLDKLIIDIAQPDIKWVYDKEIRVSDGFKKAFRASKQPNIDNPVIFAQQVRDLLQSGQSDKVIKINDDAASDYRNIDIFKKNINFLSGYVLVKKYDKIRFSTSFLRSDNKDDLPGNLITFRNELKNLLGEDSFESIYEYEFKIDFSGNKKFETFEEGALHRKLPRLHEDSDVEEFFNKLKFVVSYPNQEQMNELLEHNIKEKLKILDGKAYGSLYRTNLEDWMADRVGTFYTPGRAVKFFKEIGDNLEPWTMDGLSLSYFAKAGTKYKFQEYDTISKFLEDEDKKVLDITFKDLLLGRIRVCQSFKGLQISNPTQIRPYIHKFGYIFLFSSDLSGEFYQQILNWFNDEEKGNLLVIECDTELDEQKILDISKRVINKKKVILLSKDGNVISEKFSQLLNNKYKPKVGSTTFYDLNSESQETLLKKGEVIFQGKEVVSLGELITQQDLKNNLQLGKAIEGKVLSNLVTNKKIEIGKALTDWKYDDVKDYYIPRKFYRHIRIKKDFKKEKSKFFVTYNDQINELDIQQNQDQDIVLVSDIEDNFKKLCDKYKKRNIHWLKEEQDDLIWQKSYGASLSKLLKFIDISSEPSKLTPKEITGFNDKIVIIAAEPGMGKSTVLTHLAVKTKEINPSSSWIVRVNLLDHSVVLSKWKESKTKIDEVEAVKFICRSAGFKFFEKKEQQNDEDRNQMIDKALSLIGIDEGKIHLKDSEEEIKNFNSLEVELFNHFYNQGKIALMFDGFDEISPGYNGKAIELLETLKSTGKVEKLLITTRRYPYVQSELEDKLNIFSYSIKDFSELDQKKFLKEFWEKKLKINGLDEKRFNLFTNELIKRFSESTGDREKKFMRIALHTMMIAEVFKDIFKRFYLCDSQELSNEDKQELSQKLNLATLYERFIEIKFKEIRFGEKKPGMNIYDPDLKENFIEKQRKELVENHKILALYTLFKVGELKKLFSQSEEVILEKVNTLVEEIKKAKEKNGIIDRISDDGKPVFVHRTFAEYFAAKKLSNLAVNLPELQDVRKKAIRDFLLKYIFNRENEVVRHFFDLMLAKDKNGENKYKIHNAVLGNNEEKVKELLEQDRSIINTPDRAGRTPLHLAAAYGYYGIVETLLENEHVDVSATDNIFGWRPLSYADKTNQWKIAELLLENRANGDDMFKAIESIKNGNKNTVLHIAAEEGFYKIAKVLLNSREDNLNDLIRIINTLDQEGNLPLCLAIENGHTNIIELLLKYVKDKEPSRLIEIINPDDIGEHGSPLFLAVENGNQEIVKILLEDIPNDQIVKIIGEARDSFYSYLVQLAASQDEKTGLLDSLREYIKNLDYDQQVGIFEELDWNDVDRDFIFYLAKNLKRDAFLKIYRSNAPEIEQHFQRDDRDSPHPDLYLIQALGEESSEEECLSYLYREDSSSSGERKKREISSKRCLFTWEDVDEFNEEKDEKRDFSKIKIDGERFVSYIKDLPEEKQSQLIQLASGVKVTGESQSLVNKLISNQKVMSHLSRVGRISGMTMHGMMAKNVLADFLNRDYQGVAINVGFIAGGQGFAKVAEAASIKGLKLASEGKLLLGRSLRAASPFLARGTSAFVVYDLVNQVKAFKNGTEEALVGVVGDSIYLGVDAAEIGVEVAEAFGVLEGVSSVTGPIGAAIGAVVFVGTDIYMAVKRVDKIDEIIHLTGKERFVEGLHAFIGMKPEPYIEDLMEKKQLYNQLVKQGLEYLKQHNDIQSYVFPTGKSVVDSCRKKVETEYAVNVQFELVIPYEVEREECQAKFEEDLDSKVLLDRKRTGIRWSRARPDDLNGGRVFCLPQGNDELAPDYGSYLCESAIGVTDLSANKTGGYTLINLGEGKDNVKGFTDSRNIFVVNNGSKEYYGGNKDDIFVLQAGYVKGYLSGEGGINTLDTTSFAFQEEPLNIRLDIGEIVDYSRDNWLRVCDINKVIGRKNRAETITVSCNGCNSNVKLIDGQSGNKEIKDKINIVDNHCSYQMQVIVRPNTVIYNRALEGNFDYLVPLNEGGSAEFIFIFGPERFNVNNTFWFGYEPVDIKSINVRYINIFNRTEHEVKFNFVESNKEFNVTISYSENPAYRLGKSGEIRIGNKGNLYMLESSDKSSEEVIRDYLPVANRVSKMSFFIQSVLSNETVVIGSGNHEVIHSNPAYRSHLVGNGGENVYVIDSETKEVIIHDVDEENSIDTIDLRNVVKKGNCELKVIRFENDLLLRATVKEQAEYCTVRLKDGVERYNKTHVILENVPMTISFDNNQWSLKPQPLMFERDKEVIVVTGQDVEEGNEITTPRKGGNYKFVRSNDNDLMITNAFDSSITKNDLCTITLSKFYETPRMKTLFIKFADKEIVLKDHEKEISTARDVNVVKKEHKDQVYDDVFNHTKSSPEVIMLSDQPVTHRHRHSRHTRHHRSTTSSSTRPTGWINDLFGWVKSSVSGLLSSKPESTKSPISQVDARVDVNGTIMLLDMLIRKFTGQKYISTVNQPISPLEAQGYTLNIIDEFEKVVKQTARDSNISIHRLNIDFVKIQEEVTGKIMSGKFNEISGILSSYVEKAFPGRGAGYPGKLSEKRFNEFMAKFNKGLDVTLNQSIEHNGDDTLEVNNIEEQQGPRSYLNNTSIQGHLTRNKVKLIS